MLVLIAAALGCQAIRSTPPVRDALAGLAGPGEMVGPYRTWQEAVRAASKGRDWKTVSIEENCCFIIVQDETGAKAARFPLKGGETFLDAVSCARGLSQLSQTDCWIERSPLGGPANAQVLPVDWDQITSGVDTRTNYLLLPGDRLFIAQDEHCGSNI